MNVRRVIFCVCVAFMGGGTIGRAARPSRNVFWPIGRVESGVVQPGEVVTPEPKAQVPEHRIDWDGARSRIQLSGVSRSSAGVTMAMIDGALYKESDILAVSHKGLVYRFKILKIDDEGLSLSKEGVSPDSSSSKKGK